MGIRELGTLLVREEGRKEGLEIAKAALVTNLLLKSDHSLKVIASFADVSVDFVIKAKNNLSSHAK